MHDISEAVEVIAKDGSEIAIEAIGNFEKASVSYEKTDTFTSRIMVVGKAAIVQEFGAGYAVMEYHPFAKNAGVPIEVGSYSRENNGMFALTDSIEPGEGYWIWWPVNSGFGGLIYYDRIQPRHGLLNAYDYIMENGTRIAGEEIKL